MCAKIGRVLSLLEKYEDRGNEPLLEDLFFAETDSSKH